MKIVCPSCGAAYQVPEALLAKRHALKCSACGVKWRISNPDTQDDAQTGLAGSLPAQDTVPVVKPSPPTPPSTQDKVVMPAQPAVQAPPAQPVRTAVQATPEVKPTPPTSRPGAEGASSTTSAVTVKAEAAQKAQASAPPVSSTVATPPAVPDGGGASSPAAEQASAAPAAQSATARAASPVVVQKPQAVVREVVAPASAVPTPTVSTTGSDRVVPVVETAPVQPPPAAQVPQQQSIQPKAGMGSLAAHIARPAYRPGAGSVLQTAQAALAGWSRRVADVDMRALVMGERFWRGAWVASLVLAVLVVLGAWHWWAALVHVWPAAARLHQPG